MKMIVGKVADTVGTVADSIDQLSDRMRRMSLNEQSRKPFYCSNCEQEGHKKSNCSSSAFAPLANPVAKTNFTRYYPQLLSTQFQYTPLGSDNEKNGEDGYNKVENDWYYALVKKNRN